MSEQTNYKSKIPDRVKVCVGDIFVPKKPGAWLDASYVIIARTPPGPTVVQLGGRQSGKVSVMDHRYMQRSYWSKNYDRF